MAEQHPIEGIMSSALQNIKEMVDVNTIIGNPVTCDDGTVIIPVSKVSFGFGAGGGEYGKAEVKENGIHANFGGGSGAGVSISPVAFLVVGNGDVRMLTLSQSQSSFDRVIDMVPDVMNKVRDMVGGKKKTRREDVSVDETVIDLDD